MALSILDGNQTATTLATTVSGSAHYPNHIIASGTVTANLGSALPAGTNRIGVVTIGGGTIGGTITVQGIFNDEVFCTLKTEEDGTLFTKIVNSIPAGTNSIGVVTIGAGTVTIGAGTAQIGSVTASISGTVPVSGTFFQGTQPVSLTSLPALVAGTAQIGSVTASISGTVPISISSVTVGNFPATQPISISSVTVGNSVTIGSLPAISGTVTANIAISSSAITSGVFSSLTSATLVPANTARKMATVYNLGAGQLFVNAGASATTLGGGFMVALSSGDFYECDYTTTTLSAIFATAGTASWVSH